MVLIYPFIFFIPYQFTRKTLFIRRWTGIVTGEKLVCCFTFPTYRDFLWYL